MQGITWGGRHHLDNRQTANIAYMSDCWVMVWTISIWACHVFRTRMGLGLLISISCLSQGRGCYASWIENRYEVEGVSYKSYNTTHPIMVTPTQSTQSRGSEERESFSTIYTQCPHFVFNSQATWCISKRIIVKLPAGKGKDFLTWWSPILMCLVPSLYCLRRYI